MKLPPLPLPDLNNSTGWERTDAQVIAYGKACYLAALEKAARVCDGWERKNWMYVNGAIRCGADIRALAKEIES